MQTLQQLRAADALDQVTKVKGAPFDDRFKVYVQALPAMIHMNGLGQAVAFYKSKASGHEDKARAYGKVYEILSTWLTNPNQPYHTCGNQHCGDLLTGITTKDLQHYRLAQAEALAYLEWLKKFAEAFIEDKEPMK